MDIVAGTAEENIFDALECPWVDGTDLDYIDFGLSPVLQWDHFATEKSESGYFTLNSCSDRPSPASKRQKLSCNFRCALCKTTLSSSSSLKRHRGSKRHKELEQFSMPSVREVEASKDGETLIQNPLSEEKILFNEQIAFRSCEATTASPKIVSSDNTATSKDITLQCQFADPMASLGAQEDEKQEHQITESVPSASRIDSWIHDATQAESRDATPRDAIISGLRASEQIPVSTPSVFYPGVASLRTSSEDAMSLYESQSPRDGVDLIDELATILCQLHKSPEASCSFDSPSETTLDLPAEDGSEESGSQSNPSTGESSSGGMTKRTYSDVNGTQVTSESDTPHPGKRHGRENGLAVLASTLEAQEAIQMPCPCDNCFGTNSTISELLVRLRDRHQIIICRRCCELVPIAAGMKSTYALKRHDQENCPLRCIGASCAPAGTAPYPHPSTEKCREPWTALKNEIRWRFIHLLIHPDRPAPEANFQRGPEFQHSTEKILSKRQPAASRGQVIINQLRTQILRLDASENSLKQQLQFVNTHMEQFKKDTAEVKAKTETDHAKQIETLKLEHAKTILALEKEQTHKIKNSRRIVEAMINFNHVIPPYLRAWIEEEFPGIFISANGVNPTEQMMFDGF